jgi:hypothetical protein
MLSEPIAVTLQVTGILEELRIPYVIGGSMASTAYGRIRTTMDVDIVVDLKLEQAAPLGVGEILEQAFQDAKS